MVLAGSLAPLSSTRNNQQLKWSIILSCHISLLQRPMWMELGLVRKNSRFTCLSNLNKILERGENFFREVPRMLINFQLSQEKILTGHLNFKPYLINKYEY